MARGAGRSAAPLGLGVALFLSGLAGLSFETLWFRLAGQALGNSVWATSIVLASFMAGLALGNAWAGARAARLVRPVRTYAAIECVIGVTGFTLVAVFPLLNSLLSPLFAPFLERPFALNTLRAATACVLLMVPATAMGATLPVAVKALAALDPNFGRVLGRLYGLNTLGGFAGALATEFVLLPALGVRQAALAAGALNLAAAVCAWKAMGGALAGVPEPPPAAATRVPWRALACALLSGAFLLALEVAWFRLLLLFMLGSSAHFAVLLAVVLAGIAAGGLLAAAWLSARPDDHRLAGVVALAAGAATVLAYVGYAKSVGVGRHDDVWPVVAPALLLMLPTSVLSGLLFTLLGRAVQQHVGDAPVATARLTLANTLGAALGALAGGFVLIPWLGAEASLFLLSSGYGLVALLCWPTPALARGRWERPAHWAGLATLALLLAFFPFGLMQGRLLDLVRRSIEAGLVPIAVREGRSETIQYVRSDLLGEPRYYRLITNGFAMSGTSISGLRYMGLYVQWPLALRPQTESALLISYGVGITARALVETRGLRSIDVVDTSREILSLSAVPFGPEADPLRDPRVRVHVEDGRFFLQTTRRRFDLITGEPPPPKAAGIVNLYSREHFALMRSRLTPRGLATYWLPVQELEPKEAKAIVAAFCHAFTDCTLWTGSAAEWMLAGSGGGGVAPSAEGFARQWEDPVVGPRLADVALETPADLGALFLGDAAWLAEYTRGVAPLTDDRPSRLSSRFPRATDSSFLAVMAPADMRARFERSDWVARNWPEPWRRPTTAAFDRQGTANTLLLRAYGGPRVPAYETLFDTLTRTPSRALPLLVMGSWTLDGQIADRLWARGDRGPELDYLLGLQALSRRDYGEATRRFGSQHRQWPADAHASRMLVLSQLLGGEQGAARETARVLRARGDAAVDPGFWRWLDRQMGPASS